MSSDAKGRYLEDAAYALNRRMRLGLNLAPDWPEMARNQPEAFRGIVRFMAIRDTQFETEYRVLKEQVSYLWRYVPPADKKKMIAGVRIALEVLAEEAYKKQLREIEEKL